MDLVTIDDLERLAAPADGDEPHVSLFLPTHRAGSQARTDPLRWKNLLTEVEATLAERGTSNGDIKALLAPAWELHGDALAWQYVGDALAMFLRPGWHRTLRVPIDLAEVAVVADRFVVGPLLAMVTADERFLVLAVSQRSVRLLKGSRYRVEDVKLTDVPTSLRDVIEPPEPRSNTLARPASSGKGGAAVFYGHGAADDSFKKDEAERFLRLVDTGLREVLAGRDLPMVLAGLDPLVSLYREVNTYPHVLTTAVRQNPDQLSTAQLHEAAWPIVRADLDHRLGKAIARYENLQGTGQASSDPEVVAEAAAQSRIDTLFLAADRGAWQPESPDSPVVFQLGVNGEVSPGERLDRAAMATLSSAGKVYVVPRARLHDTDVAAVFRY